jgi:flagellar hook-associated protein 2
MTASTTTATNTAPVSIASSTSAGAAGGSVINVSSLVSQLVAATQDPQQALINGQTSAVTAQISSLGTLKSALSTFQSSLSALDDPSEFDAQAADSSNSAAVTVTAGSGAPVGTYSVSVTALAQAQQLLSNVVSATGTTAIGTGTLQLSLGGADFTVAVTSSNDTLAGIAAAINSATGNPGISATVVQGTDGAHLLLSSAQTGVANTIQVSETDTGAALAALTYPGASGANYKVQTIAQDASYSIAGVPASSPSNTITSAISGLTLTLTGLTTSTTGTTTTDTPASVTVSTDTSTIESNVSTFVAAYNTLQTALQSLGGFDSATNTAGPMMGSALLSGVQNQIQSALYSVVDTGSTTYNTLASVGITTNSDGSLSLNSSTLANTLATNFSAVSQLFSGTSGVATGLNTVLTETLSGTGSIASKSESLTSQEDALTTRTNQLDTQMASLSATLTQQYAALNTLLSSLQTESSYLSQAFQSLPTVQGTSNA